MLHTIVWLTYKLNITLFMHNALHSLCIARHGAHICTQAVHGVRRCFGVRLESL